ncbi:MAG: hypothetical protein ACPMAQ_19250, partial [Phycisphaerae bacterium]
MRLPAKTLFLVLLTAGLMSCAERRPDRSGPTAIAPPARTPAVRKLASDLDAIFDQPKYACAYWGV